MKSKIYRGLQFFLVFSKQVAKKKKKTRTMEEGQDGV
jgi:hypothetical protein